MAEKLIPGISYATRIAILQQIDSSSKIQDEQVLPDTNTFREDENAAVAEAGRTVLQQVLASDHLRNEVRRKINILAASLEGEDPLAPVLAVRRLRHEQLEKQLFLAQKNANLRSGTRGLHARKELKTVEAKVAASLERLKQNRADIDTESIRVETQAAVDLLEDLQSQYETQARRVLLGLGFKEDSLDVPFCTLSGGWRMRCMLAGILIQNPDIMILDEPTNFLDLLGVIWLENYLKQLRDSSDTTLVLVSHDRDFVNATCEELIILRDRSLSYFRGNLAAYEANFEAQKLYWSRMKEAQERQIAHMEATIRENIKHGKKTGDDAKLRMAKSRQKKIDDRMGVQVSARGGRFKLNRDLVGFYEKRRAEIEVPQDEKGVTFAFPDAPDLRFPGPLISLEGIVFRYRRNDTPVLSGVDLVIHLGDRVGIMGLNGCGKSTLLQILTGSMEPSQGKTTRHPRLKIGYYAQNAVGDLQRQGHAEPELTALSLMMREVGGALSEGALRGLLSSLGLAGRTASDVPACRLSGGQISRSPANECSQVRLALAKILWNPPHLLVLDEITTHLDFHTVTALASALSTFSGAILIVSHDRFLVRSVIEGKREPEARLDEGFEGVDEQVDESQPRRRVVCVLKGGKLIEQADGVEQFERNVLLWSECLME
ncbi:ABC ATPase [Rasamsonia emersonii CBS 393.64]|uniref:ABC ATPase n=1 Tax=Rasamsonia emersonii (strain ATCC 16479 / CBS 393.64 / IMI 116815) TaxID=1408163 RepID=A0A0F4YQ15_RASE3|nr:ABC ATPase [Rasamsonia emersonii CBS 393.64]KKA20175.1 ABC ATPase [Rasamsonia emersonii CBS 393.64]